MDNPLIEKLFVVLVYFTPFKTITASLPSIFFAVLPRPSAFNNVVEFVSLLSAVILKSVAYPESEELR
jgi:hypothetical protein